MQCAFCKENIDDDSFYCDMCGEEIKACASCNKAGKGKICTACGTPLCSLKERGKDPQSEALESSKPRKESSASPIPPSGTYQLTDEDSINASKPQLQLLNKNVGINLMIDDNSIIGRVTGQYVGIFGGFNQISGKHCCFNYDPAKGWCVKDLGSTNKTRLNNQPLDPHTSYPLGDMNFLKIANIEFYVRINLG